MGRFFSLDSPLMATLSRMADLMILNLLVLVMCIPIITIGPTITAMHFVLLKMVRKEEGYVIAPFFKSFRENFKQTAISGLIVIILIIIFIIDLRIINASEFEFANWLRIALLACGIIGTMTLMYLFPLFARFNNTIRGTFKNALFMSILNLPRTVLMIAACVLPVLLVALSINMYPVVFLLGITGPGYLCAMLYSGTFKRFEPEEEKIDADSWSVSMAEDEE
ncbi:MAG: DUF624 domain-containing protein [Lachnospiraceae bacterium]|nr:DUF624 domain-containing protein [Lachnospiraceae bacterium]